MSITVTNLVKHFGTQNEVVGVNHVTFTAPKHCITSLLGPSGSGKSTLLRLVAGLEVPEGGAISIDGIDVTNVPVRQRQVGFVFQNYALFGHMNVFDNVAFGLTVRGDRKADISARVYHLLQLVQLQDYAHRRPEQLSGGQRQRVALARALATEPRVLLLDEPFGALDTRVRLELREWLHRLHEQTQVTTLLVTHDQEEALELSQHVVLLKDGRVEQAGSPTDLYEQPNSSFVASFMGGAKVLTGSVEGGRAVFAQQAISTSVALSDGMTVEAFVRPHDVRVRKASSTVSPDRAVTLERVIRVGNYVKLSIVLPDGDRLMAHMPWHELHTSGVQQGDRVLLDLRDLKVSQAAVLQPAVGI